MATSSKASVDNHIYPLILSIPESETCLSWIRSVEEATMRASRHAYIGYEHIMETSSARTPQVKVSIDLAHRHDPEFMSEDDNFPLVLNISTSSELRFSMRHNFTVPRMNAQTVLDHITATIQRIIEEPRRITSTLSIASAAEELELHEYGKASVRPQRGLLHSLIERQVKRTPSAVAVQFETDTPIAYADLNQRANQLARELRHYGCSYIPVHMRNSSDFIVALLAILKAGAAYVILDPDAKLARKVIMLEDMQANIVLVDDHTSGQFQNEKNIRKLLNQSLHADNSNLISSQHPSSVAYVIYTSGSTGKPKAVQLEHQAAYNGLVAFPKIPDLRQLLFFNPVFSAAQRTIWATLSSGGQLCLASKESLTVHLERTINTMKITSIDMTSSTAKLLSPDNVPSLQRMVLGGEPVSAKVVGIWSHRLELYSSYGLSECTQLNWRQRLRNDDHYRIIGQPFDTTTSYVLEPETTNLCPLLVPGELCLGGAQLARGYLGNEKETLSRFIPNPFSKGRLYRTGDMAVRHADGSIEMVGRSDFQIKINGQRIDPGEPNGILQAHPEVENSAIVPAVVNEKPILVAAVVPHSDRAWEVVTDDLRSFLATKLPLYMIPSSWVSMVALPTNGNGKIDMAAIQRVVNNLAHSGQLRPDRTISRTLSSGFTTNERLVRDLWAETLSISANEISSKHSFLSLGGTSLEAIQVVSKMQAAHGLALRVEDILLGESLAHVAALCKHDDVVRGPPQGQWSDTYEPASLEQFGIVASEVDDVFPVTPFQEAVIADSILGGTHYIYSRAYHFTGHLVADVKSGLETLMVSDKLLRATFVPKGASFLHVIYKMAAIPWEESNLGLKEYLRQQSSTTMQIGSLWWKAAALPGDILVLTTHHALFDYWSNEFLPQDLSDVLLRKPHVQRPDFRGYVGYLNHHVEEDMRQFWKGYLSGAQPIRIGMMAKTETVVHAKLTCDIKRSAAKLLVTPSVLLYAAWSVILSSIGSTGDVVMGVTLSGRDAPVNDVLRMSGPTLMIAPLRVVVGDETPFTAHLKDIQSNVWNIAKHAKYGLRKIFKASAQSADIFHTMVNFLMKLAPHKTAGGLKSLPDKDLGKAEHIKLEVNNDNLEFVTLTSNLDSNFAQLLIDSVSFLLGTATEAPETTLWELKTSNHVRALANFNQCGNPCTEAAPANNNLSQMNGKETNVSNCANGGSPQYRTAVSEVADMGYSAFRRMAALYPQRMAVQDVSGDSISYAGLGIRIDKLAALLKEKGVELEQAVPIMLEKSINTIVAMFGVIVSGAAFLTLGPENPRERNIDMMDDSESRLVITDRMNAGFFEDTRYDVLVIDDLEWDSMPIQRPYVAGLAPDNLAYIVYTSGSTGRPKGTLISHKALAAAVEGIIETTNMTKPYRILWTLNYTFDGSFDGLFSTLGSGCTLCVAPQSTIVGDIAGLINKMKVNRVNVTPSMTSLFDPDHIPGVEVLLSGGEAVTPNMLAVWAPRMAIYNVYGPTEAAICVTSKILTPDMNIRNIGRPFRQVNALILDPDTAQPVRDGEVGELCLSGPQLARGYLNRPDATNKVFRDGPNGRMYQTGDLAKLLPNGEIELFGRKDDQVKINGYRIELGEIENAVTRTGHFEQCVVFAATVLKKKQLVAFVTSLPEFRQGLLPGHLLPASIGPDVERLKGKLTTLPRYMVPEVWLPITGFPLMPSGKINRKQMRTLLEELGDEDIKQYLPEVVHASLETENEILLQSLWSKLFEISVDEVHGNSSFHSLGGDSISALNLVSMLRRHGFDMKVNEVLSSQTLRNQAAMMTTVFQGNRANNLASVQTLDHVPFEAVFDRLSEMGISKEEVEDVYRCGPGQIEFLTQGNKEEQFWQLMTIRPLPEDFDVNRWIELTTKLTERNQILRALYLYMDEKRDPQKALQVILKHSTLNLRHQIYGSIEEKQRIIDAEWEELFDPTKPFVRYTLLEDAKTGHKDLTVKLDHASYDGTLLHIFDDQFKALNHNVPILKHTLFKDYILHVTSLPKQPQLDYWTKLLQDSKFTFPSAISNPKITMTETAKVDRTVGIDGLAVSSGVTAPIVFQTAYTVLLAHLSGTHNIVYDNLITGRNVALDNPQLINGTCANFLPFSSQVKGKQSIGGLLKDTQAAFWATTEHGFVSLGEIYDALGRDRTSEAAKCLFCFQPFEPVEGEQDAMRWIMMKMSKNTMKFNYAIQLEVVKAATKGDYIIRFGYDGRAFPAEGANQALQWYIRVLKRMSQVGSVEELTI